jgi:RNA polymerase-binding protein DksA
MNAEVLKPYKARLVALRVRLRGDVSQMTGAVLEKTLAQANGDLSAMPIHMADIGTDNFEREFTLTLMESKDRTLEQIEEALERIEDGIYGVCEECEGKIPKARLNAIPYTTLCVKCASRLEPD